MSYWSQWKGEFIGEVYEVVKEFEVVFGGQSIKIKLLKDGNGKYYHRSNYHYHGETQSTSYEASDNGFSTPEEAIRAAKIEKEIFYGNGNGKWVKNEDY